MRDSVNKPSPLQLIRQAAADCILSHVINDYGLTEADVKVLVNYDKETDGWIVIVWCFNDNNKDLVNSAIDKCWVLNHLTGPKFIEWR